jgi:hypothetical protein
MELLLISLMVIAGCRIMELAKNSIESGCAAQRPAHAPADGHGCGNDLPGGGLFGVTLAVTKKRICAQG